MFLGAIGKTRWPLVLLLAETLWTSSQKRLNQIQRNLTGSKISTSSTKFVFFRPIVKIRWCPGLWLAETFSTSPLKLLNGIHWNLTGSQISMSSTSFDQKNKTVALADPSKRWHIVPRCTKCGPLGPLFYLLRNMNCLNHECTSEIQLRRYNYDSRENKHVSKRSSVHYFK